MATATNLGSVPAMLRERMTVIALSGYTDAEKQVIAIRHLLPLALAFQQLTADNVRFTDAAVDTIVRGYARKAGVWGLTGALGEVCGKVVRRRCAAYAADQDAGSTAVGRRAPGCAGRSAVPEAGQGASCGYGAATGRWSRRGWVSTRLLVVRSRRTLRLRASIPASPTGCSVRQCPHPSTAG